jgi:hypothetical protein
VSEAFNAGREDKAFGAPSGQSIVGQGGSGTAEGTLAFFSRGQQSYSSKNLWLEGQRDD